jgi:hypothetical protein
MRKISGPSPFKRWMDSREVVADAEAVLEEERGSVAADPAPGQDGLPVRQDVRLVHEVRRQQDHLNRKTTGIY